jgi:pyrimidine deaminase RibD-like protein
MSSFCEYFMHHALRVSRQAWPACRPNPPVGCVLVKEGRVVASGYTKPPGQPHAEAMALSRFSGDLSEVTVYVTLEPCAFYGRTPSCAQALAASGIKRVVIATLDPDPRNAGAGVEILRAAGIEVIVGVLEPQVLKEIGRYLAVQSQAGSK